MTALLHISDNRRVNRLAGWLSGVSNQEALSETDQAMLDKYEAIYSNLKEEGGLSRFDVARKAADDFGLTIRQALNLVRGALELFGQDEFPGLTAQQVFMVRKYQHLYKVAMQKCESCGEDQQKAAVEYFKQAEKALHRINMITGSYRHKDKGIDYGAWEWPTFVATADERVLAMTAELIEKAEILAFEEVTETAEDGEAAAPVL